MESLFFHFQISTSVTNRYQAAAKCVQTIREALLVHVIKGTPMIVVPTHVHKVGKECVMKTTFLSSQPKHMLYVLKRTVSMRWYFEHSKYMLNPREVLIQTVKSPMKHSNSYCYLT